jgi:hypothetical protein
MTNTVLASPGKTYRSSMYSGRSGVPAAHQGDAAWDVPSCLVMRMGAIAAGGQCAVRRSDMVRVPFFLVRALVRG